MAEPTKEMVEEEAPGGDDVEVILNELSAAQRRMESWMDRGEKVISLYRGEGDGVNPASDRFNILWANIETQRPFIYSNTPKPIVRRRFLEPDPPARVAAEVMERALDYFMECEGHEYTPAMRRAVSDFLLLGSAAEAAVPMGAVIARELEVLGSHGMPSRDYPELLALVGAGAIDPRRLVGRVIGLEGAPAALAGMSEPAGATGLAGITVVRMP